MRQLTGITCVAIMLFSLPVQAGTTVKREPGIVALRLTGFGIDDPGRCAVPQITLPALASPILVERLGKTPALDLAGAQHELNRSWALNLENRLKAHVNHFMEHVVPPSGDVNLHVTQTNEDVPAGSEPEYRPNSTLGAVELVVR